MSMISFTTANCQSPQRQSGVSLIIVMMMLVIIGITSAATIRNATSSEKLTNNIRVQYLAQQYAEAALRFCESELGKPETSRVTTLAEVNLVQTAYGGAPAWNQAGTWTGSGGASASKTVLPENRIKSTDSAFRPPTLPECVVEKQVMADGNVAYVITARGFSTDYRAASGTGLTTSGSVAWLQSTVILN
jgi:type IV pilus assembly protein PilX